MSRNHFRRRRKTAKATDKRRQKRGNRIKRPVVYTILIDFIPPTRHALQDMTRSVMDYAEDLSHRLDKLAVSRYTELEIRFKNISGCLLINSNDTANISRSFLFV